MIDHVLKLILSIDADAGVLLTGSAVLAINKARDLDLIVISNKDFLSLLKEKNLDRENIVDNSFRFYFKNKEIGIVSFTKRKITTKIRCIINGEDINLVYKSWAIGCEFPEGFLGDIRNSIILKDTPDNFLKNIREKIQKNSSFLMNEIKRNSYNELATRLIQLKQAKASNNFITQNIIRTHIIIILIRLYFTSKGEYCRGIKHFLDYSDDQNLLYNQIKQIVLGTIDLESFLEKEIKKYEEIEND